MKDKNKIFLIIGIIVIICLAVVGYLLIKGEFSQESFTANTILLKSSIVRDTQLTNDVKISNNENKAQLFDLYFSGLDNIASVDKSQFTLVSGESTNVKVSFSDIKNEVNVYVGYLIIETSDLTKKIPIVLNVEDVNPFFAIIQKPLSTNEEIIPGGKLKMDIRLFDLKGNGSQNINIKYLMKNFNDEVLISEDESLIIDESTSITKILNIPDDIESGDYVFITSIEHNGKSVASYFFEISKKKIQFPFGNLEYFALIVLVFVIGMFWLIFRFFGERDKLILQLQKQQQAELKNNLQLISECREKLSGLKNPSERKIKIKQLNTQEKTIISKIKEKHKLQKIEIKKLSKRQRVAKLSQWKKQGYTMSELKKNIKNIPQAKIRRQIAEWKKQGYKVGVLEK